MATKFQRDHLPSPSDVGRILDADAIAKLAGAAGIEAQQVDRFGRGLRRAVRAYLESTRQLQPGETLEIISKLHRAATAALDGKSDAVGEVVQILETLPAEARDALGRSVGSYENLPAPEEVRDPELSAEALRHIRSSCVTGAKWVPGRRRPGGKRSRPTLKFDYAAPRVWMGRPKDIHELLLCSEIGYLYTRATGKAAERWRKQSDRGPFVRLVGSVLHLLGVAGASADDVVRRYQKNGWGDISLDDD